MPNLADQATELRRLAGGEPDRWAGGPPRHVAVLAGKPGAGATTFAVNLAAAAAQSGRRALLVDADPICGDAAAACGVRSAFGLGEVLSSECELADAVVSSAAGVDVVCGGVALGTRFRRPAFAAGLIEQVQSLDELPDIVYWDCGCGPHDWLSRVLREADLALVTTADSISLLETYAAIKVYGRRGGRSISVAANRCPEDGRRCGWDAYRRLQRAAWRHLQVSVAWGGEFPLDEQIQLTAIQGLPLAHQNPTSTTGQALRRWSDDMISSQSRRDRRGGLRQG